MRRYLYATTSYYNRCPEMKPEDFPPNNTTAGLVEGLAAAHAAYNVKQYVTRRFSWNGPLLKMSMRRAKILFVVQAGERNVFDQRLLEYELLEKYVSFRLSLVSIFLTELIHINTPI
jgi:glutathione synthase